MNMNNRLQFVIVSFLVFMACETNVEDDLNSQQDCIQVEEYYTENIKPILESSCTACHSGSGTSGGLSLDNYTAAYSAVKSGDVLDRIQRESNEPGFMPSGGQKLSAENISLIQTFFEMKCQ